MVPWRGDIHGGGVMARGALRTTLPDGVRPVWRRSPGDAAADDGDVHERTILRNSRRWIPDGRLVAQGEPAEAGGGDVVLPFARPWRGSPPPRPIYARLPGMAVICVGVSTQAVTVTATPFGAAVGTRAVMDPARAPRAP